jgi:hypothetical protein
MRSLQKSSNRAEPGVWKGPWKSWVLWMWFRVWVSSRRPWLLAYVARAYVSCKGGEKVQGCTSANRQLSLATCQHNLYKCTCAAGSIVFRLQNKEM